MVLVNHRGWKILPFISAYRLSIYQVKQCTTPKSTSGLKIRNLKVKKSTKEKLSTRVEIEWGKITSEVWSFLLYGLIRDFFGNSLHAVERMFYYTRFWSARSLRSLALKSWMTSYLFLKCRADYSLTREF